MEKNSKIVIVGAGIFGLSTAQELAKEGYRNVVVLDRHMPPVPDGSSNDISRVVRFDYADEDYVKVAHEAYQRWRSLPKYRGIFHPARYIVMGDKTSTDSNWMDKTTAQLSKRGLSWTELKDQADTRRTFPLLTGALTEAKFVGYHHKQAGWADAAKAVAQLRDECLEAGISFICGSAGTVTGLETTNGGKTIRAVRTAADTLVQGDHFILVAGAWTTGLVNMYGSTLSTGQVVGFTRLTDAEMQKYKDLPIYTNFSSGWFNFPPHEDTNYLKFAVHGWGYTLEPGENTTKTASNGAPPSLPPTKPRRQRANFVPEDGEQRLRDGLRAILPELADRPFEKVIMCWYTDTPTGDFIMDYHPDYDNLFVGGGGSGHAFKFLPVLGEYMSRAIRKSLPPSLVTKWRFRTEYLNRTDTFVGDGSRGGPNRRALDVREKAALDETVKSRL